ncbi:MAG: D-alanyl-D-alanine carboxypeptidase family protein [Magnetococcales bacterium]|nr:D-alanyl-D-alanine carboxypeptidase family protein [Magnetococcales bacterium]
MKRRDFLRIAGAGAALCTLPGQAMAGYARVRPKRRNRLDSDQEYANYLDKIRLFDRDHPGDFQLDQERMTLLNATADRFRRLQKLVGFANFTLLGFDRGLRFAKRYPQVGSFTREELDFLEMIFSEQASLYGFFGDKPLKQITARIPRREVVKIPRTGNYLYKGSPQKTYERIRRDVGDRVILTSGVRSVVKQFLLFLSKAQETKGNLSRASRALAPPGYSFHGISDFDVGQVGFGALNFTERFVTTDVFRQLRDLGHVNLRYPRDNSLGVRFEPWHVKVTS